MMTRGFYRFLSAKVATKFAASALLAASSSRASSAKRTASALYASVISSSGVFIGPACLAMLA
ncbi:hypothetical protein HAX54_018463, partial [Datura stramonium]|nr:hypothetical protein [Datura stramonium]